MWLILLSFLLDAICSNYFGYLPYSLSLFQPCFYIVIIVFLFFNMKNKKKYLRLGLLWTGLGCLMFQNLLFLRLFLFYVIFLWLRFLKEHYRMGFSLFFISLFSSILIFQFSSYLILSFIGYNNASIILFLYQFSHSLIFNLTIGVLFYYILGINRVVR